MTEEEELLKAIEEVWNDPANQKELKKWEGLKKKTIGYLMGQIIKTHADRTEKVMCGGKMIPRIDINPDITKELLIKKLNED